MKKNLLFLFLLLLLITESFSQNVGIGTNTPAFRLDVLGRMRVKTGTLGNVSTSSGIWFEDYRNGTNQMFFGMKDSIRGGFYGSGAGIGWDLVFNTRSGVFSDKFDINGPVNFRYGSNDYFSGSISADSNDVYFNAKKSNSAAGRGNLILQFTDPSNPSLIAGNIGLGIDSPFYKLSLNGDIGMYNGSSFIGFFGNSGSDLLINSKTGSIIGGTNPDNLILQYSSTLGATTGRVGISTNAPTGKLHVFGSSGELFRAGNTTNAIQMTNDFIQFIGAGAGKFFMQLAGNNLTLSNSSGNNSAVLTLNGSQVTIGQITPATGYKLSVGGKAICEELKVQLQGNWPDYVFKKDYQLKSFDELRSFIQQNNHLPNIPKASELEKTGIEVGEMQRKMMEKIEELTLYILQLEQQMQEIKKQLPSKS
jgi:hypothetical protein